MKKLDKLFKSFLKNNKNYIKYTAIFTLIGIIAGSVFYLFLNELDKTTTNLYLKDFILGINNINKLDFFRENLTYNMFIIILIWILGISVLGGVVNIFIYFTKTFIAGFTLTVIFNVFGVKGITLALIYLIPNLVLLFSFMVVLIYSLKFSKLLLTAIYNRLNVNFKLYMNKYAITLLISIIICLVYALLMSFIFPTFVNMLPLG